MADDLRLGDCVKHKVTGDRGIIIGRGPILVREKMHAHICPCCTCKHTVGEGQYLMQVRGHEDWFQLVGPDEIEQLRKMGIESDGARANAPDLPT